VDCSSIVSGCRSVGRRGVEGALAEMGLVAAAWGGGLEIREVRRVPMLSCSRDVADRNRGFRSSEELPMLLRSWFCDMEGRSRGFRSSPPMAELPPPRLSLEGEGRIIEAGLGRADVGLGMPDVGRGKGSLERRGIALMRFCEESSMINAGGPSRGPVKRLGVAAVSQQLAGQKRHRPLSCLSGRNASCCCTRADWDGTNSPL
jgi:hypothetical protein